MLHVLHRSVVLRSRFRRLAARGATLTIAALLVTSVAATGAGATTPVWTVQTTPDATGAPSDALNAISCPTSTFCAAGGSQTNRGVGAPLVELRSGAKWTVSPVRAVTGDTSSTITGISCATAMSCVAVGRRFDAGFAEHPFSAVWNGTTWSEPAAPEPANSQSVSFGGVSCPTSTFCVAVGSYTAVSTGKEWTLIETWNGAAWSIVTSTNPGSYPTLTGVSCATATDCVAVGTTFSATTGNQQPLAEVWNGTSWTTNNPRIPAGRATVVTQAVSCSASTACTAVGYYLNSGTNLPLAERWNGTTWSLQPVPVDSGATGTQLMSVSCASATGCTAAGWSAPAGTNLEQLLVDRWDGSAWTSQHVPALTGTGASLTTAAVACADAATCTLAGSYSAYDAHNVPEQLIFADGWNGTSWIRQSITSTTNSIQSGLLAVSCSAPNACTAVGYGNPSDESTQVTLGARWNGTSWRLQHTVNDPSQPENSLSGVSCPDTTHCVAVGQSGQPGSSMPAVQAWDGTTWVAQQPALPTGAVGGWFGAVSCPSATSCVAVGTYQDSSLNSLPLAEIWDGTAWKLQHVPASVNWSGTRLVGVSCTSSTSCTAVGDYLLPSQSYREVPLAVTLVGTSWSSHPAGTVGSNDATYLGVSCSSATSCTAVGIGSPNGMLVERFDGTSWTRQDAVVPSQGSNPELNAVSCTSDTSCTAVGFYSRTATPLGQKSLVETWDGTGWSVQSSANPAGATGVEDNGVSCTTGTACTLVGDYHDASNFMTTLAERRT